MNRITPQMAVRLLGRAKLIPRAGETVPNIPQYQTLPGYWYESPSSAGLYGDPFRAAQILRLRNPLRCCSRFYACGYWDGWEGLPPEGGKSRPAFRPPPGFLTALRSNSPHKALGSYLQGYADGQNGHAACWLAWRDL